MNHIYQVITHILSWGRITDAVPTYRGLTWIIFIPGIVRCIVLVEGYDQLRSL
jgi:hypothetical protein